MKLSVIGLGYVGLPLAVAFGKKGNLVSGIDINKTRINLLKEGKSYVSDVLSNEIEKLVKAGFLKPTTDFSEITESEAVIICVPTPLRKNRDPDISYVLNAAEQVKKYLRKGQVIILESTVYPGVTEEVLLPLFESSGLKCGSDFYLAFSPERVDPGRKDYTLENTPKIVGGVDEKSTLKAAEIYANICTDVVKVRSARAAEMAKLLENTFRAVNIGLVNEIAQLCYEMGIDVWEVIEAAATKPYGFMKFVPGPGIGGHCIPIDPLYLSWKAKSFGFTTRFINLADEINQGMQRYVVSRIGDCLNEKEKPIKGSKIVITGVSYKKDIADVRESPAYEVIRLLLKKGAQVMYNDPYVKKFVVEGKEFLSMKLSKRLLSEADCVVIMTDHSVYDYDFIVNNSKMVLDTRNATRFCKNRKNVVVL